MKKEKYLSPSTRSFIELEVENSILQGSQIDARVIVNPLEEYYYEGEGTDTDDYLIVF